MSNFNQMPAPPMFNQGNMAYDMQGNPVQAMTYAPNQQLPPQGYYTPQPQMYQQQVPQYAPVMEAQPTSAEPRGLGANFSGLIGTNVSVPVSAPPMVPADKKRKRKSSKSSDGEETTEIEVIDPKQEKIQMVEETIYADTYAATGQMLRSTISQVDELAGELKLELNKIRNATNMKGKYTYIANISGAMTGLLGTKVTAIREINSSIKAINEAEYRRYKDSRTVDGASDSKAVMDLYNTILHNPTPVANYYEPNTLDLTAGLNGIIQADIASPQQRDMGFQGFLNGMTPEQNAMIQESNPFIEECIVYDQATGKKYFDYIDTRTGTSVPNMPVSDPMFMEDYVIDPRTRIAKNANLRTSMKVIYKNEGAFSEY